MPQWSDERQVKKGRAAIVVRADLENGVVNAIWATQVNGNHKQAVALVEELRTKWVGKPGRDWSRSPPGEPHSSSP